MLELDRAGERLPGPPGKGFLARHGRRLGRALAWGALLLGGLGAAVFAGDDALLRYRVAAHRDPFAVVMVQPYYAVRLKSGKTEFLFQEPRAERCVNSLFPHFGQAPCWYARHHRERRTEIGLLIKRRAEHTNTLPGWQ